MHIFMVLAKSKIRTQLIYYLSVQNVQFGCTIAGRVSLNLSGGAQRMNGNVQSTSNNREILLQCRWFTWSVALICVQVLKNLLYEIYMSHCFFRELFTTIGQPTFLVTSRKRSTLDCKRTISVRNCLKRAEALEI